MTALEIAHTLPMDAHGLIRRAAALAVGWTDAMLSSAVRSGTLIRLALGVYVCRSPEFDGPDGADRLYRLRCIATTSNSRDLGATVLSHQSAAALHGLALLKPNREHVHVTRLSAGGATIRGDRRIHACRISDADIVDVDGIRTTSLTRTAADVAESVGFEQSLTVFDAALRLGADRDSLAAELGRRRIKGARLARIVLPYADPRSASVGESWSRTQMIEEKLVVPDLQRDFTVEGSDFCVDFWWRDLLIGEFDGLHKYGRLLRPGETVTQAVIREKRREDLLRRHAKVPLVRWIWADLERRRLVPMLREYLA